MIYLCLYSIILHYYKKCKRFLSLTKATAFTFKRIINRKYFSPNNEGETSIRGRQENRSKSRHSPPTLRFPLVAPPSSPYPPCRLLTFLRRTSGRLAGGIGVGTTIGRPRRLYLFPVQISIFKQKTAAKIAAVIFCECDSF